MTPGKDAFEQLRALKKFGEYVEITITVRAKVIDYSTGHGLCAELQLECGPKGYVADTAARRVWLDADEIIEVQP